MTIPSFTAEASLYATSEHYRSAAVSVAGRLESGRFRGVRFEGVRVGLGKLLACLNLPYRLLRFINSA